MRYNKRLYFSYDIFTLYKFPRLQFSTWHICPRMVRVTASMGGKWTSKICRELKIDIFVLHTRLESHKILKNLSCTNKLMWKPLI